MRVPFHESDYGGGLASLSAYAVPDEAISSSYEVELRSLDSYGFDNVTFIKIDVEGHEESVLAGARETLERCHPTLLVEIEERHNPGGLERIVTSLSDLGYYGSFFYERIRRDISDFVPRIHHIADRNINSISNRRKVSYVNNFIFQ